MADKNFLRAGRILAVVLATGIVTALLWRFTNVDIPSAKPTAVEPGSPEAAGSDTVSPESVGGESTESGGAINIVLVVVDTERADVTTPYGARLPTTPFLSELSRKGVVFTTALSKMPW